MVSCCPCKCCRVANRYTIILEIVTVSIFGFFLTVEFWNANVRLLLLNLSPVLTAVLGIVALKNQDRTVLGQITVVVAIASIVLYGIQALSMIIEFYLFVGSPRYDPDAQIVTDEKLAALLRNVLILVYVACGQITSGAIMLKHLRVFQSNRLQYGSKTEPNNTELRNLPTRVTPEGQELRLDDDDGPPLVPAVGNIYFNPQCQQPPPGFQYNPQIQQQTWNPNYGQQYPPASSPGYYYNPLQGQPMPAYAQPIHQPQPPFNKTPPVDHV